MTEEFAVVWQQRAMLLDGFLTTLWISALASAVALALGALLSTGLMSRRRVVAWAAELLALVVYHMAYMAELLRGAWRGLPAETVEAGRAFGFHGFGLFRRVILPPVLFAALPTLGNQVVQVIKDSAFLTIIAVQELTHAATAIQATFYVPFASFIVGVGL